MKFISPLSFLLIFLVAFNGCAQDGRKDNNSLETANLPGKNRLEMASSPYLQQHADNPVDWYEWGPEALEKAKKENKPLLISIGYAACHWCHVMEHESFMDTAVARVMNENFISIKIDREERPDIDQIYMEAAQMINGSGGWPLNAFALPDGRPFYAGTYFPTEQWTELLLQLSSLYENEHSKVVEQAELITQGIISQESLVAPVDGVPDFSKESYQAIFENWEPIIDYKKGGYGRTPKFPIPIGWEFLLQYHYLTGEKKALDAVTTTLDAMDRGGIYDQIGGGFARYSTDEDWFAPHFEKMLYDNGQLVSLYAHAYKVTKNETYAEVVRETLAFIKREMSEPTGGFYSSLNADSEGEEGTFYVWKEEELRSALGESDYPIFKEYFQVTQQGNWESGNNILHRKYDRKAFAKKKGMTEQQWESKLAAAKKDLLELRAKRERPSTDDKVLTAWNALMLKGYVDAFLALGETAYLETALSNAHFLEKNMVQPDGALWRSYKDGEAGIEAFLDDYSLLADAYIALYQATLDIHWLQLSKKITDHAILHFRDRESGLFYYTSDRSENLIARKMELSDNVIPSSNSVMAQVLFRLGEYYQEPTYTEMSREMLHQMEKEIVNGGPYMANWAMLLGMVAYGPNEVAIMGENAIKINQEMQQNYLPNSLFMGGEKENLPLLENKLSESTTTIYVCRNRTCKLPVRSMEKALGLITK